MRNALATLLVFNEDLCLGARLISKKFDDQFPEQLYRAEWLSAALLTRQQLFGRTYQKRSISHQDDRAITPQNATVTRPAKASTIVSATAMERFS